MHPSEMRGMVEGVTARLFRVAEILNAFLFHSILVTLSDEITPM